MVLADDKDVLLTARVQQRFLWIGCGSLPFSATVRAVLPLPLVLSRDVSQSRRSWALPQLAAVHALGDRAAVPGLLEQPPFVGRIAGQ